MANIYAIQQDLLSIFDTIEENEGEITPEIEQQLAITQTEFKDKIQAYTAVIKQLELDITGIKAEKCRLNDLQKSKEKTIDRLKQVMVDAIQMFGETSKSGSKFIDFGTGKVSLRHSDSIEVDEDGTKQFVNRFFSYFNWLTYTNQLDTITFNDKVLADYCNSVKANGEEETVETDYTAEDIEKLQADLSFRVNLKDMFAKPEGVALMKTLMQYTSAITSKPVVDKASIKKDYKNGNALPTFSKYVSKENITIK